MVRTISTYRKSGRLFILRAMAILRQLAAILQELSLNLWVIGVDSFGVPYAAHDGRAGQVLPICTLELAMATRAAWKGIRAVPRFAFSSLLLIVSLLAASAANGQTYIFGRA